MPTYEYACDACGHEFEREQRISDKPVKKCPSCKRMKARRMIGGGSFILKGGGWYADGYASTKGGSSKGSSDSPSSSASSSDSSSSSASSSDSSSSSASSSDSSSSSSSSSSTD
jgi:putative FmdB family regulatory protein